MNNNNIHTSDKHHRGNNSQVELYVAIASGVFWLLGLTFDFLITELNWLSIPAYILALLFGGFYASIEAAKSVAKGKFDIDFLMIFAGIGAASIGKWGEGALLLFLFSLGHALEHFAMNKARKSITALTKLTPAIALLKTDDNIKEVPLEELEIGDVIVVRPNSKIGADGVVLHGQSTVNEAPITGESIPVDKGPIADGLSVSTIAKLAPNNRTFAGTINGNGTLEIKVLKLTKDSTLARLIKMVKEAEEQKSPTQHLTDKFEKYYVPTVLVLVLLLMFSFLITEESFQDSFYRSMAVLIAASPCALAISTPSAVLSGIAKAARHGVLIKGGKPLEDIGDVKAIAFDKTGTLTEGKPQLTKVVPFDVISKEELITAAVAVEELSDHPLANAIVEGGMKILGEVDIPMAENLEAITARGVKAFWNNKYIYIGNRRFLEELTNAAIPLEIDENMAALEAKGQTAMIVYEEGQYLGIIAVMDVARKEAKATLAKLHAMGIKRTIMLTGDNQKVANAVAKEIGITDPKGNLLPEDKVLAIEQLIKKEGKVAMLGDGVNDAPALAKSTIGIAMGAAGSDVALETADVALMADKLDNLPFVIALSRKAKQIIKQNLWISLGMVAILVPLTMLDIAKIGPAVIAHEGSTLMVVLNALRLLNFEMKE